MSDNIRQPDFIEVDVGALLNIADQLGAFKSWFKKNTELSDSTYARRLNEVARLFDICSTYHHERGDYETATIYGRNAAHMRDLSHGLRHGGQIRETVIVNLSNMITGVKTTIDRIRK